ncbi:protein white [Ischnura elegans]|uniref:protein white n=1 Tax=Ischnura elegans TaxID=197161 RepID=UPI001ED86DF0|nr:protein white [Ischnura elegans]
MTICDEKEPLLGPARGPVHDQTAASGFHGIGYVEPEDRSGGDSTPPTGSPPSDETIDLDSLAPVFRESNSLLLGNGRAPGGGGVGDGGGGGAIRACYGSLRPLSPSNGYAGGLHPLSKEEEAAGNGPFAHDTLLKQSGGRIAYTWWGIDVFSADVEDSVRRRRQRLSSTASAAGAAASAAWRRIARPFSRRGGREERGLAGSPRRKHILKHVSGVAYPGEFLAILGSSGAGKTTLLNALTFRTTPSVVIEGGLRALNGVPLTSSYALASLSAYVQQDDLFIGTLTVREHLVFQALVRMDKGIPYKHRMRRVDEVISELALTKCQDTLIGVPGRIKGISGGEMKRLSFASEVLTDPPLMFCDEPTSGLDSFMAYNVVSVLKGMARKGKTVICTIHQPSSEVFALFDKVLLMAEGRVAFQGTPRDACTFFMELGAPCPSNYNPADFFVQLLAVVPSREDSCRQAIDMICDTFAASEMGVCMEKEASAAATSSVGSIKDSGLLFIDGDDDDPLGERRSPYKADWCSQFRAVFWRSWLSMLKEPILMKVRVLQTLLVALLLGFLFFGQELSQEGVMNINGALFLFLTSMTFQNVFAVINVFCSELPVFMREHLNGMYRTDVYFLCKTLAEVPIFIVIPVVFTCVSYYLIGLNPEPSRFLYALLIVSLVANVATSFGYMISCLSKNVPMALSIGPPVIIPFLLFGGFFLNIASVPVYFKWLSYLSWFKYGNEALVINQWDGIDSILCERDNNTCMHSGHIVLETLSFHESDFNLDIISLCFLLVLFRTIAFVALLIRTLG